MTKDRIEDRDRIEIEDCIDEADRALNPSAGSLDTTPCMRARRACCSTSSAAVPGVLSLGSTTTKTTASKPIWM